MKLQLVLWFFRKTIVQIWGMVAVLLPVLKLVGIVGWPWWLVMLPAWLPIAVLFCLPGSAVVYAVIVSIVKSLLTK